MVVHFFLCHSVTYGATQSWVACQKRWRRRRLCICVGFVLPVFLIVGQTPGLIRSKLGTRIHLDPRNVLGKWRSSSRSTSKHCRRENGGADSLHTASNYINVCPVDYLINSRRRTCTALPHKTSRDADKSLMIMCNETTQFWWLLSVFQRQALHINVLLYMPPEWRHYVLRLSVCLSFHPSPHSGCYVITIFWKQINWFAMNWPCTSDLHSKDMWRWTFRVVRSKVKVTQGRR